MNRLNLLLQVAPIRKLWLAALVSVGLACARIPARAQEDSTFHYKWNGFGYYAGGSSVIEPGGVGNLQGRRGRC
jgi:hypothetical protein